MTLALLRGSDLQAQPVVWAEMTTAYHQIKVFDENGIRTLSFDGSMESQMSVANPEQGHFEYTEYFHMPWLWNSNIARVLMIGLGGGSTQRAYERHYPDVTVETVELDPAVRTLARQFFHLKESSRQIVHIADGRRFLRRSDRQYDVVILDAYAHNRYGSYLPQHLATKEFFELVDRRLSPNGVICYNVMGTTRGEGSDLVWAIHRTLHTVFPQVYWFPAVESQNVVLLATKSKTLMSFNQMLMRVGSLAKIDRLRLPRFRERVYRAKSHAPYTETRVPILTDDYAPLESLLAKQSLRRTAEDSSQEDK